MTVDNFLVEESEREERIWILPYKLVAIGSMFLGGALICCTMIWYGGREDLRPDPLMTMILVIGLSDGILQLMVTKILCLMELRNTLQSFILLSVFSLITSGLIFTTMLHKLVEEYNFRISRWEWIAESDRALVTVSGITFLYKGLFLVFCAVVKCIRRGREVPYLVMT